MAIEQTSGAEAPVERKSDKDLEKQYKEFVKGHETGVIQKEIMSDRKSIFGALKKYQLTARPILGLQLYQIESSGNRLAEAKMRLQEEGESKDKEIETWTKELAGHETSMSESFALLENDPNHKESLEKIKLRFAEEKEYKAGHISRLQADRQKHDQESEKELAEIEEDTDFSARRDSMLDSLNRRLGACDEKLSLYEAQYQEFKTRGDEYRQRISDYEKLISPKAEKGSAVATKMKMIEAKAVTSRLLEKIAKAENDLKERLETIKAEKKEVEAYVRRMELAGKTAAERKEYEEQEKNKQENKGGTEKNQAELEARKAEFGSREVYEQKIVTAFGGHENYEQLVGNLSDAEGDAWQAYLDLHPDDRGRKKLDFDPKKIKGKNAQQAAQYLSSFIHDFEQDISVKSLAEWSEVLFGNSLEKIADAKERLLAKEGLKDVPHNYHSATYSEEWALRWYCSYRKAKALSNNEYYSEVTARREANRLLKIHKLQKNEQ
jgi:chromosome segregation ATPase